MTCSAETLKKNLPIGQHLNITSRARWGQRFVTRKKFLHTKSVTGGQKEMPKLA